jgi:putative oxidoreductase
MNSHSHTDCACLFTSAKMETLSTSLLVVSWICRIVAAVILLQTLYFKFSGAEESVYIFTKVGLEPWGRYASGVAELFAALLLLFPRTTWLGAFLAAAVMVGAMGSHLTKLGIVVRDDGGLLFALAVVVFAASLVTLVIHRRQIPLIGNMFASAHP